MSFLTQEMKTLGRFMEKEDFVTSVMHESHSLIEGVEKPGGHKDVCFHNFFSIVLNLSLPSVCKYETQLMPMVCFCSWNWKTWFHKWAVLTGKVLKVYFIINPSN